MEHNLTGYPSIDKPWLKYYSDEAVNTVAPQMSMYSYLKVHTARCKESIAVNYFGNRISFRKLLNDIDRAAAAFYAMGVKEGTVVTVCAVTTPELICSIYGLNKLGAVCNIIEPRVNIEQIMQRIIDARSEIIVLCDVFFKKLQRIIKSLDLTAIIIPMTESMPLAKRLSIAIAHKPWHVEGLTWSNFLQYASKDARTENVYMKNNPAVIIYTGGTTGISKGVLLSNEAINSVAQQYVVGIPLSQGKKFLNIMPPFIAYGLICGLHMPLSAGIEVIVIPKFDPEKFASLILKYRPQFFLGVPSHYEKLMQSREFDGIDLSFIELAGLGGDALNSETEKNINTFLSAHNANIRVDKGYGMTEMCSSVCTTTSRTNELGSVGAPLPLNTVAIFEPNTDKELEYGERGEICIRGPAMMLGYLNNPNETANVIKTHSDGTRWVHSQDIGYMNNHGSLFVVDRIKRMLIRPDGHNVWPSQIENVICSHPNVSQCAVVGQKETGSINGVLPAAFVVLNGNYSWDKTKDELIKLNYEKLPERDVAQYYYPIDSIPLTPVGKIDYQALERIAAEKACSVLNT